MSLVITESINFLNKKYQNTSYLLLFHDTKQLLQKGFNETILFKEGFCQAIANCKTTDNLKNKLVQNLYLQAILKSFALDNFFFFALSLIKKIKIEGTLLTPKTPYGVFLYHGCASLLSLICKERILIRDK